VQIKSKKRVTDHGEVFTASREVNAMLDLVRQETDRIDSRFLEPACGTGNFLIEILRRKLNVVEARYQKSRIEYERYAVIAVTSIYGVDILQDNVMHCQQRLFDEFEQRYRQIYKLEIKAECLRSARYVLSQNICWGDALTMQTCEVPPSPIIFPEWSAINGRLIKRRDFSFANLLAYQPMGADTLFSDMGEPAIIQKPVKEYPPIDFLMLGEV
jgi:hypothetical protein